MNACSYLGVDAVRLEATLSELRAEVERAAQSAS
jgi:hypothetical protein